MISPATRTLLEGLPARGADWEARVRTLADINSGSTHRAGLDRVRTQLAQWLAPLSDLVEDLPGSDASLPPLLRAVRRPDAPVQVLLNGHYDTVYAENHPFQTCRLLDPRTLHGPGVTDMKGGLVILCAALEIFSQHPLAHRIGWEVLLNPDEETGSYHSRDALRLAAARHDLGLVFEPSPEGAQVIGRRLGTMVISVTVRGQAAHGSLALTRGRNAVVALAEFIHHAHLLNQHLPGIILNVGNFHGGGEINVVPDQAIAELHVRVPSVEVAQRVMDELRLLAAPVQARPGFSLEIQGGLNRPPKEERPGDTVALQGLIGCASALGQDVTAVGVSSASDANFLSAAGLPVIDGLGIDGDDIHSDREICRLDSLQPRVALVAAFLASLAEGTLRLPSRFSR